MIFFFDACFPNGLARAAQLILVNRHEVLICDDEFPRGTTDTEWIHNLGNRNPKPIVVGGDGKILRNPAEKAALQEAELTFFVLAEGFPHLPINLQASRFFFAWEDIVAEAQRALIPAVFKITAKGKVERICETRRVSEKKALKKLR